MPFLSKLSLHRGYLQQSLAQSYLSNEQKMSKHFDRGRNQIDILGHNYMDIFANQTRYVIVVIAVGLIFR